MPAYDCSPRFNRRPAAMGYAFQLISLAGFHRLNASMFSLARSYACTSMPAYMDLQMVLVPVLAATCL